MATKNTFKEDFQKLQQVFRDLPYDVAEELQAFTEENFRKEAFQDKPAGKWKGRKKDPESGKARKERRALLVESGEMKNSIDTEVRGSDVSIGIHDPSIAEYARVHNEGLKAGRGKGFMMPQRQFIGESAELDDRIQKLVDDKLDKIFK
jgi:phage gpG-like protein